MHPLVSGLMADAHREDLLREAEQHRLVRQARGVSKQRLTQWQASVTQIADKVRLLAKPAPAAVAGCAPQPVCCPA
ncbi:hypothetical protein SAMN04489867_2347 [Pedococcus dokdonensis]|uniref:Uncharacterized protein n=1 Tax=Pedococcus dokdonensis TaxID=443156 RepID=A0A1H0SG03_9MICO|nr:hypothetical protein [Pedococcus dokdonensis]SDP40673.1 hypothetical protein SAMN04489867_2347 [Pedococcus dokdonensis]